MLHLYVDADACPVKEEIIRVATRHGLEVYMVSGRGLLRAKGPKVYNILAGEKFDAADDWIAERVETSDIVITADIPLASRCLEKGATVLGPTGRPFTKSNIGSALAMRELNAFLRDTGEIKGHNPSFSKKDRSHFLQELEETIQKIKSGRT